MQSFLRRSSLSLIVLGLAATAHADPPVRSAAAREADRAVHTAELAGRRLLMLLDESRLAGNADRARCVDRKLSEVNSFGRRIEARRARLAEAERAGDRATTVYERSVIRTLLEQLAHSEREGRACIDPDVGGLRGSTIVVVTVDPDTPREDLSLRTERGRLRR